ncbi:type IV pilus assembly protein FimV [sulfur-oxidizing endosymbiont of Gigantopelta aegis]|uniref:type IV pilus assembly protein FimV n=1 Tax=sulfur-oxidizing endosymbiont of Gigantopelta aegis TaxID=2794934 RepID=UPI0018DCA324|nr:FimV/HubP family polar landmark protein [sulfur-oxidizing endosymbiont of Gigantopelta aegis]
MLKKSVFFFISSLVFPSSGFSLGLGDITVFSSLNTPLKAQIVLVDSESNLVDDFVIKNASFSTYQRAGLPRPEIFKKVRFKAVKMSNDSIVIELSSKKPIREPFITFIADLKWPKGHLNREYTFLLDPPEFIHKQIRKAKPTQKTSAKKIARTAKYNKPPRSNKSSISRKNKQTGFSYSTASETSNKTTYTVKQADTLWEIAKKVKSHKSASTYQTMQALFELNPHAFINNNINLLKQGQVLQLPDNSLTYSNQAQKNIATNKKPTQNKQNALSKQNTLTKQVDNKHKSMLLSDLETRAKSAIAKNKPGNTEPEGHSQLKIIPTTETLLNTPITSKADLKIINQALKKSISTIKSLQSENENLSDKINALTSQLQTLDSHNRNLNSQISIITEQLKQEVETTAPISEAISEITEGDTPKKNSTSTQSSNISKIDNDQAIVIPKTNTIELEVESPIVSTNKPRSFVRELLANPVIAFALAIFTILILVATLFILRVQNDKRKQIKQGAYTPYPSNDKPSAPVKASFIETTPKVKAASQSVPSASSLQGTDISDEKDEEDMDFFEYFEKKMNTPDEDSGSSPANGSNSAPTGKAKSSPAKGSSPIVEAEEETDITFELNISTAEIEEYENSLTRSNTSNSIISEIDTYLAYGNYSEAETRLLNELKKMPTSKDLHLKLFDCYSSANQRDQFIQHVKNNIDLLNVDLVLRHRVENIFQQSWNAPLNIHQL